MKRAPLALAITVLTAAAIAPQESVAKPRGMAPARAIHIGVPLRPVVRPFVGPRVMPASAHRAHAIHHAPKPHAVHPRHHIAAHHHPHHRRFKGALGFGLPFTAGAGVYYGSPALIAEWPDHTGSVADVPEEQNPEQLRRISIRYGAPSICRSERVTVPSPGGMRGVTVTRC
jgi:hypothetical protein